MKLKAFKILLIILIIAILFFGYSSIQKRYSNKTEENSDKQNYQEKITNRENTDPAFNQESNENNQKTDPQKNNTASDSAIIKQNPSENDNSAFPITTRACDYGCVNIPSKDEEEYCKQICGLSRPAPDSIDCSKKSGLEKDYCTKDKAISKNDFNSCDEISDTKIKAACQNRITENLIETQK